MDQTAMKLKSWWEKPDGRVGQIVIGILIAIGAIGVLINLNPIIAWLALLAANTLKLVLFSVAIGGIFLFFSNKKVRATLFYLFRTVIHAFTGLVIELDPISILTTYLEEMKKNIQKTGEQIGKLRGSISTLTNKKDAAVKNMDNEARLLKQAQSQGLNGQIVLHANQVGRLEKVIITYDTLLNKLNALSTVLQKIYDNTKIIYEDTKNDIDIKKSEWDSIKMANSAMKSAMSAISGDPDKRAIYEQTLDFMQSDLGNKVGEMQQFLIDTSDLMQTIDLQSDANVDRGLEIVEKLEKNADGLLSRLLKPEQISYQPVQSVEFNKANSAVLEPIVVDLKKSSKNSNTFDDIFSDK